MSSTSASVVDQFLTSKISLPQSFEWARVKLLRMSSDAEFKASANVGGSEFGAGLGLPLKKESMLECCVLRPANGCFACHSLVKINFLALKQFFTSFLS